MKVVNNNTGISDKLIKNVVKNLCVQDTTELKDTCQWVDSLELMWDEIREKITEMKKTRKLGEASCLWFEGIDSFYAGKKGGQVPVNKSIAAGFDFMNARLLLGEAMDSLKNGWPVRVFIAISPTGFKPDLLNIPEKHGFTVKYTGVGNGRCDLPADIYEII